MIASPAEMEALARQAWGEPNPRHSTREDLRFGNNGSKSVKLKTGEWFDHEADKGGGYRELYKEVHGKFPPKPDNNIKATYDYHTAKGKLLFQVVRKIPKQFYQRRPNGSGGWQNSVKGLALVPYRLPELLAADPGATVFITEGEKDVDNLRDLGFVATTNAGGAGKWRAGYNEHFHGRHVVVLPDNDPQATAPDGSPKFHDDGRPMLPGQDHAADVAAHLSGVADSVRVLMLPNLPLKGDVSDWLAGGGTAEALDALVKGTSEFVPAAKATNGHAEKKTGEGQKWVNVLSLVSVITVHPLWRNALRLNKLTETIEVCERFPPTSESASNFRSIREPEDVLEAMLWFQGRGFERTTKNMVWDALLTVACRNSYHPVVDYLDKLKWDGTPRVRKFLIDYFHAAIPDDPGDERDHAVAYLEHISQCWFVSAVARVRDPGCKVDHTLIALSEENFNKSKAIRALCRDPAWFMDDLATDLLGRDTKESLHGKWIVELAEFPHGRKEAGIVKAFFSKQTDRYRRAYDKTTQDWPRQAVFFATTNDLEFLDPISNRRWWPFEPTEPADVQAIERDRDQLWAEASSLYAEGYQWWLKPNIEKLANEQQEKFKEDDIWQSELRDWIEGRGANAAPFTLADAMVGALGFPDKKEIKKPEQMRAVHCLKNIGYRRRRKRLASGKPEWVWISKERR